MGRIFGLMLVVNVLGVGAAGAEPMVRMHTSYYYVDGSSATVIAALLEKNGPVGADGQRRPGKTSWDVQWKFNRQQEGVTCTLKDINVAVGIAQNLPKWRGESKDTSSLKARWQKFADALKRHEEVHKENAVKAGKEIEAALLALKPASNCEDLELSANAAAEGVMEKYRKRDAEYDRSTDFGRNQGASLL